MSNKGRVIKRDQWTRVQKLTFVQEYVKHKCLLFTDKHETKEKKIMRNNALLRVCKVMSIPGFGPKEAYKKIRNLRSTYAQELKKLNKGLISESSLIWFDTVKDTLQQLNAEDGASMMEYFQNDPGNPSDDDSQDQEQLLVPRASSHTDSNTDKDFIKIEIQDEDSLVNADTYQDDTEIPAEESLEPAFQIQIQNSSKNDSHHLKIETVNEVPDERHEFDVFGECVAAQLKNMPFRTALEAQMNIQHYLSNLRLQLAQRNPCACSAHRVNTNNG